MWGVQFDVRRKSEKCLSDDITKDSFAMVYYNVIGNVKGETGVSMMARDPNGKYLKEDHNIDVTKDEFHTFSFTADGGGTYTICFYNNNDASMRVLMDFKHGVDNILSASLCLS